MAIQKLSTFIGNNKVVSSPNQKETFDLDAKLAEKDGYLVSTAKKVGTALVDTYKGSKEMIDKGEKQIATTVKDVANGTESPLAGTAEAVSTIGRTALGATGKLAEGVGGVLNAFVPDWLTQLVDKGSKALGDIGTQIRTENPELASKIDSVVKEIDNSPLMTTLVQKTKDNPDLLPVLGDAINTILLGVGLEKGAPKAKEVVTKTKEAIPVITDSVTQGAKDVIGKVTETVKSTTGKIKEKITTTKTPEEIAGEVTQGTKREAKQLIEAIPDIDIKKVKTAGDLRTQSKESIKKLVKEQDAEFETNPNKYKLNQLATTETVGTQKVVHNYVKDALEQLDELYTKTNDPVGKAKVNQLQAKVDTLKGDGLTTKEVNEIAREYNSEFGSKAFGKTGEPLTSVNAQAFENTRKGVKNTAREKMPTEKSKELDTRITNLATVERLSTKLESAVNKLSNRMSKPNILQKISSIAGKVIDVTGIKSLLKKSFDIGSKESTMSPIELESRLSKNLQKLEDSLKKSDDEILKDISELLK